MVTPRRICFESKPTRTEPAGNPTGRDYLTLYKSVETLLGGIHSTTTDQRGSIGLRRGGHRDGIGRTSSATSTGGLCATCGSSVTSAFVATTAVALVATALAATAFAATALLAATALAATALLAATIATTGFGSITTTSWCSIATVRVATGIATTALLLAATTIAFYFAMKAMEEVHESTTAAALAAGLFTSTRFFTSTVRFGIATSWGSVTSGVATTSRSGITTAGVTTTTNAKHTVEQFESVTMLAGAQADA